jgi:hypothetical protein
MAGCAIDRGPVYTKDGKQYGVTSSTFWRNTWWQHYERGLSYAAGEFWDDARASFQAALASRLGQRDQRRANTYGLHFIDNYFPHRELGIVYYRLGRYQDALGELTTSLDHEASAKAKFYLNQVRRALLQQSGRDTVPPRVLFDSPADGLLTNRFTVMVTGHATDDSYVSGITINGRALFIELADPRLAFAEEVALHDGQNTINIVVEDLLGQLTSQQLTVYLDRHGPLLSLKRVERLGTPPNQRVRVQGLVSDSSRITRFVLGGSPVSLQSETAWTFRQEARVRAETTSLPFEVEDAAGNVTRGDIELTPPEAGLQKTRQEKTDPATLPRWAALHPSPVIADLVAWPAQPLQTASLQDRDPPRITFNNLEDREIVYDNKIYLEGKVTDVSAITVFAVAGESHWKHECTQLFFGYFAPLRAGQPNSFLLEAVDEWGNRAERSIRLLHQEQQVRQLGSRLRVFLVPFVKRGEPAVLAEPVFASLFDALVEQKRFDIIAREPTLLQQEIVELAAAAKAGKAAKVEGIVIGTVIETEKLRSLDVYARYVDVDTEKVHAAEDVYGEALTPRDVKTLMAGLALKLQRHFPRAEGLVIAREGQKLWVTLSSQAGMQPGTKLLVFREGKKIAHGGKILQTPPVLLGEARITAVSFDLSEARLLSSAPSAEIQESDSVITK